MDKDYRKTEEGKRRFTNPEVYQKTVDFQNYMQSVGIAWHNPYSDECCSDFACCTGVGDYHTFFPAIDRTKKFSVTEAEEIFVKGAQYAYPGVDEDGARVYFLNRIEDNAL
jgi:hypothetical protein